MQWWINNIDNSCHYINMPNPNISIYTDASLTGWGFTDGTSASRGFQHKAELDHINVSVLSKMEKRIHTYCKNKDFLHFRVMCDNATAISYVNNMGDIKSPTCNTIACRIWDFCTKNQLWL